MVDGDSGGEVQQGPSRSHIIAPHVPYHQLVGLGRVISFVALMHSLRLASL